MKKRNIIFFSALFLGLGFFLWKWKAYFITLVILLSGGMLTLIKWKTWFYNPPEAYYITPARQDRINITPGEDGESERFISWRSDSILSTSYIEFTRENSLDTQTITASGKVIPSRAGISSFYRAKLSGLIPGSSYNYRLHNGNNTSPWLSFSMPDSCRLFSFIYLGDVQDKEKGDTGDFFTDIHKTYPQADFWAFSGDVIERPTDAYWTHWFSSMENVLPATPLIVATGNHEYLKGVIKLLDPRWTYTFSFPQNGPKGFKGRSYYINYKDVRFIVIDTDGIQGPGAFARHKKWLKKALSTSSKTWNIVMMHHPVYSVRSKRNNYFIRQAFKPIFEKYNVQIVLQGHDHGYSRITTKSKDLLPEVPIYVVSNSSPKTYLVGIDDKHDRLGSDIALYQYITIKNDTLHYQSFTHEHQLYDDLVIARTNKKNQVIDRARHLPEHLSPPPALVKRGKVDTVEYNEQIRLRKAKHRN